MLVCNFLAAGKTCPGINFHISVYSSVPTKCMKGPTIAIVATATDFFPDFDTDDSVSRVAYFFTSTALAQVSTTMLLFSHPLFIYLT